MSIKLLSWLAGMAAAACGSLSHAGSFSTVAEIPFAARAVLFDVPRGQLYLSQLESNRVCRVNLQDGSQATALTFDFGPDVLTLTPSGQTLCISFPGAANDAQSYIQTFDLDFGTAGALFSIPVDPTDLVLTDRGVLVTAGSSSVKSFHLGSGQQLSTFGFEYSGHLAIDSTQTNVYGLAYGTLRHFTLDAGTGQLASPASRTVYAGYKLFLHPNGTNLITENGAIYTLSTNSAQNLTLVRQLPFNVEGIALDGTENAFFASTGTNVHYCNAATYDVVRSFAVIHGAQALALHGNDLVSVSVTNGRTYLQRMPNPAVGSTTNTPPLPAFTWSPSQPDTLFPTLFDGSATTDSKDPRSELLFRWDWNSDGQFDSEFSPSPTNVHRFSVAGEHRVTLEVKDTQGMSAMLTLPIQAVLASDAGSTAVTNAPFTLPFAAVDSVMSRDGGHAYLTDPVGKRVVEIDLVTGRMSRQFACTLAPVVLALKPDEQVLYAGLTPEWPRVYQRPYGRGLVQEFDLAQRVRTREMDIQADPFDMIATTDSLIISGASYTGGSSFAYYLATTEPRTNFYFGSGTRLSLHPSGNAFYGADTGVAPSDIYRYNFTSGGITNSYDSPYHGTYPMDGNVWVHPNGRLVLTRGSGVFTSSRDREEDMLFVQLLENRPAEDVFFDERRQAFFTINSNRISYYNSGSLALAKSYPVLPGGRFVFANTNSLYAVSVLGNVSTLQVFSNPAVGGETNLAPTPDFTWQVDPEDKLLVRFDARATIDDIDPPGELLYRWDFDDDGVFDTVLTNSPLATYQYPLPGSKLVTLQVKDRHGALATKRQIADCALTVGEPVPGRVEAIFEVPIAATAAVYDPVRPYVYAIQQSTRRILKFNLTNGLVEASLQFDYPPTAIALNPGGSHLYVSQLVKSYNAAIPSSLIAEFDLAAGFQYRTFPVEIAVYKLAATDNRIVIVTGYSKTINSLASFQAATGAMLAQAQGFVYYDCDLALHPAQNRIFIGERNLSPSAIYQVAFNPITGGFGDGSAVGSSGGEIFPHPNGTWILNAWGNVCSTNGTLLRRLENGNADGAWYDRGRSALFTGASGNLCFYNSQTLELARAYTALTGTRFVGGWSNCVYAAALQTNRLFVQRVLSPALGGETNTPPRAAFTWSPQPVGTFQTITFDAGGTMDDNTPSGSLLYRWDWEADGTFDTPFTNNPVGFHRFNLVRPVQVLMQVKDAFGAVASVQQTIPVVAALDYGVAVANSHTNSFDVTVADVVFDPVRPYLYLTDSRSNRVVRIDLISGLMDRQFPMDNTVESITVTPSGSHLFAAELFLPHYYDNHGPFRALINVFDLQTGARTRQFEIQEDPFDLMATDELLVVSGGSGGSYGSAIRSYLASSGVELSSYSISSGRRLALHPNLRSFYASTTSPYGSTELRRLSLTPGTGVMTSMASTNGVDTWPSPGVFVNPSGTNLLTYNGFVLRASDNLALDLSCQKIISPKNFRTALFVPERQVFFTGAGAALNIHDLWTLDFKHSFPLPGSARMMGVCSNRLYTLCETATNVLLVSRLLPSASPASNQPPSFVRLNTPTNGTVIPLPGVLRLDATCEDIDGWVSSVDYYLGLSFLGSGTDSFFSFAWTNPPPGTYPITAVARDNWGATLSSEPVTVTLNLRPSAQITAPETGTKLFAPAIVSVSASANDPDGTVSQVQCFLNSSLTGSDASAPYEFTLSNLLLGTNFISLVAVDNLGTPSASVTNVVVVQVPPPLVLRNPRLLPDAFGFRVEGGGNRLCVVETSIDLQTWIPVATNLPPFEFTSTRSASESVRFYRVR